MKINELKIGDRIKYYAYGFGYKFEYESIITEIRGIDKIIITGGVHIDKKDIIAKLEPQYKEIKIEQNKQPELTPEQIKSLEDNGLIPKSSIKLSELKIGDLIKYKTPDKSNKQIGYFVTTSHIKEIHSNYFIVRGDSLTGSVYCVLFENVISKLEPIKFTPFSMGTCNGQQNCDLCDKTSNFSGGGVCYRYPWRCDKCIKIYGEIKKEYKEIPIEKEYTKEFWSMFPPQTENYKEKPAPKSFKFDFNPYPATPYKISFNTPSWVEMGKIYTIEIKEKE